MRWLAVTVLAAVLLCVVATQAAATKTPAPWRFGGMVELGGAPVLGSRPGGGEMLRFLPHAHFELGLLLHNRSRTRLVVTNVRVLEPRRTLIQQIGTRFHRWDPPTCPPGASCPAYGFGMRPHAYRPRPFTVAPGTDVGVELDFLLGSCAEIAGANPAPLSHVRVTFRRPDGTSKRGIFRLRNSSLHLRMPKREDCANPRSSLSVDGPQQYESGNDWTVPGSTGDVCTIRNGRLYFVSRRYQTHTSRPFRPSHYERVTLQVGHFRGTGIYPIATIRLVAAKEVVFRSHKPTVHVTKATAREVIATVEAGRLPSGTTRGIPFHISGTIRCRVTR